MKKYDVTIIIILVLAVIGIQIGCVHYFWTTTEGNIVATICSEAFSLALSLLFAFIFGVVLLSDVTPDDRLP